MDGFEELYLLNENDVVYHFTIDSAVTIGDKSYGPEEKAHEFDKVIWYCRDTFYTSAEEYWGR